MAPISFWGGPKERFGTAPNPFGSPVPTHRLPCWIAWSKMLKVVLSGLSALRIAAWVWVATVLAISWNELLRPWLAVLLVIGALAYTVTAMWWVRVKPDRLLRIDVVSVELSLATLLVLCDGWAYGPRHAFSTSQSLGSVWPLVAVLSVGVVFGSGWGIASGVLLGAARVGATLANGVWHFDGAQGAVTREHRGVLRSGRHGRGLPGHVATSCRDRDLRRHTLGKRWRGHSTTESCRRSRSSNVGQPTKTWCAWRGSKTASCATTSLDRSERAMSPISSGSYVKRQIASRTPLESGRRSWWAVSSRNSTASTSRRLVRRSAKPSPTSANMHVLIGSSCSSNPTTTGKIFCSVKDDGQGFDSNAHGSGVGIASSIVTRMDEVGGRAEIRSRPGEGTEVCLWT